MKFPFSPVSGPREKRPQLLCSANPNSQRQGSWRGARSCLRGQKKGEAVGLEGGRAEGGCNGMAGCPGFMGHKGWGAGGAGRDCGKAGARLGNVGKTGLRRRARPGKPGHTEPMRHGDTRPSLVLKCQRKPSSTSSVINCKMLTGSQGKYIFLCTKASVSILCTLGL